MTKLIYILILLSITCLAQGQRSRATDVVNSSNHARNRENSQINEILGKDRVQLITKANKIILFRIKEFTTDQSQIGKKNRKKYFAGHKILQTIKLDKSQVRALKQNILDPSGYGDINSIDKCTFTGTVGLEIKSGKKTMKAIVSYPCKQMIILEEERELIRTIDPTAMFDPVAEAFSDDLSLRQNAGAEQFAALVDSPGIH